jgi:energy-coupling factor transporter ATP-binding protein EcfA2
MIVTGSTTSRADYPSFGAEILESISYRINRVKAAVSSIFASQELTQVKTTLRTHINQINTAELSSEANKEHLKALKEELTAFAERISEKGAIEDPLNALDQIITLIPRKILEEVVWQINGNETDEELFQRAKNSIVAAREYLGASEETDLSEKFSSFLRNTADNLLILIDTILSAFGLSDLFIPPEDDMHAHFKSHKIESLIPVLAALVAVLAPVVSASASVGLIIGGILIGLIGLTVLYVKVLRPVPSHLCHAENWTKYVKEGKRYSLDGRKAEMDEMANALIAQKPVLITGKTGVGKTEMVKGLAYEIEHTNKYPELKGKTVFYINTTDITDKQPADHVNPLEQINRALRNGSFREDVILVFDEIHNAYTQENAKAGERLKTYLRGREENFPYVIGITTEEEFEAHMVNAEATVKRFQRINLKSTNKLDTLTILNKHLLRRSPHTFISTKTMKYLYEQTLKAFADDTQPYIGLNILDACIEKTGIHQKTPQQDQKENIQREIDELNSTIEVVSDTRNCGKEEASLTDLMRKLENLETEIANQTKEVEDLKKLRKDFSEAKRRQFESVIKLGRISEQELSNRHEYYLNKYLLIKHFLQPALEVEVKARADLLEIKVEITQDLIDEVIREEVDRRNKKSDIDEKV